MAGNDRTIRVVIAGDAAGAVKAAKDAEQQLGHLDVRLQAVSARSVAVGVALGQVLVQGASRAIGSAKELATAYADAGSLIHDLGQRTGFSTQALSEWKYAADQSGTSIEGLEVGIRKMNNVIVEAANGGQGAKDAIAAVGVTVDELRGKRPEQMFDVLAAGLAGVQDEATQSALATELFGRQGTQLLPILKDGADNISKMRAEAKALGITFSTEDAAAADQFGDELHRMNSALEGVKLQIGRELLPVLEPMVRQFGDWIQQNGPTAARDLALGINAVADVTGEIYANMKAIADLAPVKKVIEVIASRDGDTIAWAVIGAALGFAAGGPLGALAGGAAGGGLSELIKANQQSPQTELKRLLDIINADPALGKEWNHYIGRAGSPNVDDKLAKAYDILGMTKPAGGWFTTPGDGSGLVNEEKAAADALAIQMARRNDNSRGYGGGSAKEDPLVAAWKAIHAEMQREQVKALAEGGERQLAEVRGTQGEMIRATQEMAQRAHEAIGIDMADAVKAAFDFMRDQAKDSAKALEDYRDALKKTAEAEKALADQRREEANRLSAAFVTSGAFGGGAFAAAYGGAISGQVTSKEQIDAAIAAGNAATNARDTNAGKGSPATVAVTLSSDLAIAGEP